MIPKIEPMDAGPVAGPSSVVDALGAFEAVGFSVDKVGVLEVRGVDIVRTVFVVVSSAYVLRVRWRVKTVLLW